MATSKMSEFQILQDKYWLSHQSVSIYLRNLAYRWHYHEEVSSSVVKIKSWLKQRLCNQVLKNVVHAMICHKEREHRSVTTEIVNASKT